MTSLFLVLLGALGVGALVLIWFRPRYALLALVILDVSNINGVIQNLSGFAPFKPELIVAVLATIVLAWRRQFRMRWTPVHLGVLILFAGFCTSFLTTADLSTSLKVLSDRGTGLLFYVVVFVLAMSTKQVESLAMGAVIILGLLAALSVVQEYGFHNSTDFGGLSTVPLVQEDGALTPRHAGTDGDVNFWARLLILYVPIALSLAISTNRRRRALAWFGLALALLLGIYLTQSRGGFIAVIVAIGVWCLLASSRSRKALIAVPFVLLAANPVLGFTDRLATLGGLAGSTIFADQSVVTRERFQLDALRMFLSSPVTGHGIGSYPALFLKYDQESNFYTPVTIAPAAHNFYLEQLADGGVILMLAWFIFFGCILFVAIRVMLLTTGTKDKAGRLLAVGVIAGLVGWLVASIFLHLSDFRAILLVAVVAALLDIRTRQSPRASSPVLPKSRAPSRFRAPVFALLAIGSLIAAPVVWGVAGTHYSVTTILGVFRLPEPVDGNTAYALDVVSRGHIPATFAAVASSEVSARSLGESPNNSGATVSISQSRLGGAIQIVSTASMPSAALELDKKAAAATIKSIATLDSGYVLRGSTSSPASVQSEGRVAAVVLFGISILFGFAAWRSFQTRKKRRGGMQAGLEPRRHSRPFSFEAG